MKNYSQITSRYLRQQKKRTILTIIGIILSVALITGVGTILVSFRDLTIKNQIDERGDYYVKIQGVNNSQITKIRNSTGIENVWVTSYYGESILKENEQENKANKNKPPYKYLTTNALNKKAIESTPITLKEGRLPQNSNEIIIDDWAAEEYPNGIKIGDTINLNFGKRVLEDEKELKSNEYGANEKFILSNRQAKYKVVGFIEPRIYSSYLYFANAITMLENSTKEEPIYTVYFKTNKPKEVYNKVNEIAKNIGVDIDSQVEYNEQLLRLYAESANANLNASMIYTLVFIIGFIIISTIAVIYNVFHISVMERISQFGILRCVGAAPKQIKKIVLQEALIVSAIGIPLGLICGLCAMKVLFYIITIISGDYDFGFQNLTVTVSPMVIGISSILGLITILLSANGPARQAARVSALEAVRNTHQLKSEKRIKKANKNIFISKLFGIEGHVAWKSIRRNRKRFVITVISMVISIVLYIVFGMFVDLAKNAEFVNSSSLMDFTLNGNFDENDYQELKQLKGVDIAYKVFGSGVEVVVDRDKFNKRYLEINPWVEQFKEGNNISLPNNLLVSYGNDKKVIDDLNKLLVKGKIDLSEMKKQNGILLVKTDKIIDEEKKRLVKLDIADINLGEELNIYTIDNEGKKTSKKVVVMGILSSGPSGGGEYAMNGAFKLITSEEVYSNIIGESNLNTVLLKLKKGVDIESIRNFVKEKRYEYFDAAKQAEEMERINIIMSIFLYGFVAVVTVIGCLNIINTISTNMILRTKELSMLKAIGMTEFGIKKMIVYESLLYGLVATIYGGILGSGLSYVLYSIVIRVREIPWMMPWNRIVVAVIGATIVAIISSYFPLKRINKGVIVENIRRVE